MPGIPTYHWYLWQLMFKDLFPRFTIQSFYIKNLIECLNWRRFVFDVASQKISTSKLFIFWLLYIMVCTV